MHKLYYYISDSTNPYENLAIEKHLLDSVREGCCILYLWQNENTVVIGKNQNSWAECRCAQLEAEGGRLARRLSGGGAVFHDLGNLNFTFLSPTEDMDIQRNLSIIRSACAMVGITAEFSGRNDLLVDGRKFSGNAFYHTQGKSYHHGTLLVHADLDKLTRYLTPPQAKLAAKGIQSVCARVINLSEAAPQLTCAAMRTNMLTAFIDAYGTYAQNLAPLHTDAIAPLQAQYASWDYLYGKVLPFTLDASAQLSFGHIDLRLQIKDGIITGAQCFTDAMDAQLSPTICTALRNCRFAPDALRTALCAAVDATQSEEILKMLIEKAM